VQKVCPPGGIAISDASSLQIPGGIAAVGTERTQVGNVAATIWLPRPTAGRALENLGNMAAPAHPPTPVIQSTPGSFWRHESSGAENEESTLPGELGAQA
jgi:hypothetical protein